jgi:hypothetical protein
MDCQLPLPGRQFRFAGGQFAFGNRVNGEFLPRPLGLNADALNEFW